MCGISGLLSLSSSPLSEADKQHLPQLNNTQKHRGPDDEGYFYSSHVALGHRRLSIIDVAGGHQPVFNEDGSVAIVFNGEIYNHRVVKEELASLGHVFSTNSDTETIVHAWEEWGPECLARLTGMFAFAIWDETKREFFVARDRLGEKPLYYSVLDNQVLIFGSELKVLKAHPRFDSSIDNRSIEDFLTFGYIPDPKTIYSSTKRLKAGHYIHIKQGADTEINPVQYWDVELDIEHKQTNAGIPEALYQRLKGSVASQMESEVPLGAFLSGGVDSSAIVVLMSQLQEAKVKTCAIGFEESEFNESHFAQMVADHCVTEHSLEIVKSADFDLIDKLPQMYDEPFADNSALPTFMVCQSAKRKVTVALSGDAGDELFVGYRRYRMQLNEDRARKLIPDFVRTHLIRPIANIYPKLDWAPKIFRAKTTLESIAMSPTHAYHNSVSLIRERERFELYSENFKESLDGYNSKTVFDEVVNGKEIKCPVKLAQYLDLKTWLPSDILTKVDRASMANGLEVRVPMLDHSFVDWAFSLPLNEKLSDSGEGKLCLKKSMEPHLPHENLYRNKMGFSSPIAEWLRGPLKEKLRNALNVLNQSRLEIFKREALNKLFEQHQSGNRDHATILWALLILSAFLDA